MIFPGSTNTQMQNEKRKRLYDHARYTSDSKDWAAYKKLNNEIIMDLKQAHDVYCNHMFDATSYTSSRKRFWSYIKNLQHDISNISTLQVNNKELLTPSDKANTLNNQFVPVFY